jgi:hypothetical protein
MFFRSNKQTTFTKSGNGKRGGARWTGRSRTSWTNKAGRKKYYQQSSKSTPESTNDRAASPTKKKNQGRGRGKQRGANKNRKQSQ